MSHIDLCPLRDQDLDAVFTMMRDPESVALAAFTAPDPGDRAAFDSWIARVRASDDTRLWVVTADGVFAGTAGAYTRDGDREVTYWIVREAWGRGIATEALRRLVSREALRPLYARAAVHNAASIAVLEKCGFAEVSRDTDFAASLGRDVEEVVFALMPAVDGV